MVQSGLYPHTDVLARVRITAGGNTPHEARGGKGCCRSGLGRIEAFAIQGRVVVGRKQLHLSHAVLVPTLLGAEERKTLSVCRTPEEPTSGRVQRRHTEAGGS
jgi:hypothetical protein